MAIVRKSLSSSSLQNIIDVIFVYNAPSFALMLQIYVVYLTPLSTAQTKLRRMIG
jgi:hypothetical protein